MYFGFLLIIYCSGDSGKLQSQNFFTTINPYRYTNAFACLKRLSAIPFKCGVKPYAFAFGWPTQFSTLIQHDAAAAAGGWFQERFNDNAKPKLAGGWGEVVGMADSCVRTSSGELFAVDFVWLASVYGNLY